MQDTVRPKDARLPVSGCGRIIRATTAERQDRIMRDSNWERWAARLARSIDRQVDGVRSRLLGDRLARQVVTYRGFGTSHEVFVSGRVLANRPHGPVRAEDAWWRNLANTLRHLESDEVPAARVRIRFAGAERDAITDDDGYFRAWIAPREPLPAGVLWHDASIDVPDGTHPDVASVRAQAPVLLPSADAEYLVISDIDDTVIRTEATRLLRMLRRTLLENARTRLPFAGVAEFYAALHAGATGSAANPIFYVSSSPWNLYAVLTEFLEHQNIPLGPIVLRDWGITEHGVLPTRHGVHKLGAIRQILDTYPAMNVILIGDSGQEDPEIYRDVVHDHGERVLAVYIRNVTTSPDRARAIAELSEEVRHAGSELLLSDDSLASARHAAGRGWISRDAVARVAAEVSSSAERPG
jgi:phosphatidate phosphatase APP1